MSNFLNHGLSALMEAVNMSKRAEDSSDELLEAFESAIDEDIIGCLVDEDGDATDDTVENDMNGDGIGSEDEKMEKLLSKIPPADEDIEDQLENLTESCLPTLEELEYGF